MRGQPIHLSRLPWAGTRGPVMSPLDRRQFLRAVGATAVGVSAVGLGRGVAAAQAPAAGIFRHGIASGDPLPDAVIIWTRVTPSDAAVPGSALGDDVAVTWEVARDAAFTTVVATGTAQVTTATDHTLQIDVMGLTPGSDHWYRFIAAGETSPVGRTRTAPAAGADIDCLRLGVVTCAEWEFGFFAAYRHLAAREDLDAILHLGDYIYEFGRDYGGLTTPGAGLTPPRNHEPDHEIITLEDYRTRYGQARTDLDLQALHAAHPFLVMYDDHEITNDAWSDGAENHDDSEGDYGVRQAAARQAWREWIPLRPPNPQDPEQVHRRFQFGTMVDLFMLDVRRYRSEHVTNAAVSYFTVDPAVDSPDRTMLGAEQLAWFLDGLGSSQAAWKVLGNPVPFFPFHVGTELATALEPITNPLAGVAPPLSPPLLVDDWNGYRFEQDVVIAAMAAVTDVVVLTGDYHESFASDIPSDTSTYRFDGNSVGVEFIAPAVTSPGLAETLALSGAPGTEAVDVVFEANLASANPWCQFHEGVRQGYGVVEFTSELTHYDFHLLVDRQDAATAQTVAASWQSVRGADAISETTTAMPDRARPASAALPAPAPSPTPAPAPSPTPTSAPAPTPAAPTLPTTGAGLAAAAVVAAVAAARRRGETD